MTVANEIVDRLQREVVDGVAALDENLKKHPEDYIYYDSAELLGAIYKLMEVVRNLEPAREQSE